MKGKKAISKTTTDPIQKDFFDRNRIERDTKYEYFEDPDIAEVYYMDMRRARYGA